MDLDEDRASKGVGFTVTTVGVVLNFPSLVVKNIIQVDQAELDMPVKQSWCLSYVTAMNY